MKHNNTCNKALSYNIEKQKNSTMNITLYPKSLSKHYQPTIRQL